MTEPLALIIEDDEKLAFIFSEALKSVEFETEIIRAGNQALNRLAEIAPAVVVLDLHLPQVSGQDILQHIKSDERLNQTRVMLATADSLMAETLKDEADLVLLKPISFTQMRDLAARLRPPDTMMD